MLKPGLITKQTRSCKGLVAFEADGGEEEVELEVVLSFLGDKKKCRFFGGGNAVISRDDIV